jgi:hypothetical protein
LFRERFWIGKLQQVLNAADFRFESYSNLDDQTIADARKSLNIVIDWVRQVAVLLEHDWHPQLSFLTHAMVTANIAFTFDRNEASVYLHRSKFIHSDECPKQYFRRPHGENCLQEFLIAVHEKLEKALQALWMGIFFIWSVTELCIIIQFLNLNSFYSQVIEGNIPVRNRNIFVASSNAYAAP